MALLMLTVFAAPFAATSDSTVPVSDSEVQTEEETAQDETVENVLLMAPVTDSDVSDTDVDKLHSKAELKDTFRIMGQGMLGIFIVMVIICLLIVVLNSITKLRMKKG